MKAKLMKLTTIRNEINGALSFFQSGKDVAFEIKRIYYIYDVPLENKRGMHAHKKLEQILWCPYGSIKVTLDDGKSKGTYYLDSPNTALIVGKGIWREMHWMKEESVLCVAASDYYNEEDYIRDYEEFIKYIKGGYLKDENKL